MASHERKSAKVTPEGFLTAVLDRTLPTNKNWNIYNNYH